MRSRAAIIVSIAMGLLAVLMMAVYMNGRENRLLELSSPKDVVVAKVDILENTAINEQMVQRVQVPATYLQPKALTDLREAIGRVVTVPVPRGAQVLGTYLVDAGQTTLSHEVSRGSRAVTIAINDVTGVGGLVRPDNFVDILGTFQYGRPTGNAGGRTTYSDERTETRTLMQNVLVIAVGQEHVGDRPQAMSQELATTMVEQAQSQAQIDNRRNEPRSVTVLVTPKQAQELVLAQEIGTLTLVLRSNLDAGEVVDLGILDPGTLLREAVPVKARTTPIWREIRGNPSPF